MQMTIYLLSQSHLIVRFPISSMNNLLRPVIIIIVKVELSDLFGCLINTVRCSCYSNIEIEIYPLFIHFFFLFLFLFTNPIDKLVNRSISTGKKIWYSDATL